MKVITALFGAVLCLLVPLVSDAAAQPPGAVRRASRPVPGRYIVVLRGANDPVSVGLETASLNRGRLRHVYRTATRGFAVELSDAAARALARDPRVAWVEEDSIVTVTTVTQSSATWGLDRIDQRTLPLNTEYRYSRVGSGIHVHVVDTGIRLTHTEFQGRAFLAGDYVDDDGDGDPNDVANDDTNLSVPDGDDCHGHGTHVAGTIGGATYGVAKDVTLWGHRVLNCSGSGSTSNVIAAVDAITADIGRRPAVVNMSLTGPASGALDAAVQNSIASGVTYVVAAGNYTADASAWSPGRVTEAITVGATGTNDARASFSNFGSSLDLFAPGVSIRSAALASSTASITMSGTSMAAPHVAGIAALFLHETPTATPAAVRDAIVAAATPGLVASAGPGSPNLLLYWMPEPDVEPPTVSVVAPNGGEKLFTGASYRVEWTADGGAVDDTFDVQLSTNDGVTYSPIPGCTALPSDARQCVWATPGPATTLGRVRVIARNAAELLASDASNARFTIATGAPVLTVTSPNTAVNWGRGSTQQVTWSHNLGANSYVRIEVSRDGGLTYALVAAGVKNTTAASGAFAWTLTGPNTTSALIRLTWEHGPSSDVSNTAFVIADPYITTTIPIGTANWGYGTKQLQTWATNLGAADRVQVLLSSDGGLTFPFTLASDIAATALKATVVTPTLPVASAAARVRVAWTNAPAGASAAVTSPANFKIEPPFVRMFSPNGGETWTQGKSVAIRWLNNLGSLEFVRLELSTDDGQSYGWTIAASTHSGTGQYSAVVQPGWVSGAARFRVTWLTNAAVTDQSDAAFRIQ